MFELNEADKKKFTSILQDYYQHLKGFLPEEARKMAKAGIDSMIRGETLNGTKYTGKHNYFENRLEEFTDGWYQHLSKKKKHKFKINKENRTKQSQKFDNDNESINQMKEMLLTEYPFLRNRPDLDSQITAYCTLSIRIEKLLDNPLSNNVAIKNLSDTLIKLGSSLGINEAERQKSKTAESKDNIASLAKQFDETLDRLPELAIGFKYKELVLLLNKYERRTLTGERELPRELFELESWAGMTVEDAYKFVEKYREKFGD